MNTAYSHLDWLPDWREASAYPDPKKTTPKQWAWEFLRRNPKYQQDYGKWRETPKVARGGSAKPDDFYTHVLDPPALQNETSNGYGERMAKMGEESIKMTPLGICLAEKYGLLGNELPDPAGSEASVPFGIETIRLIDGTKNKPRPLRMERKDLFMKYDLALPIEPQLKRHKTYLKARQKYLEENGVITVEDPRHHIRNFASYLRCLDAELNGKEHSAVASVVFPDLPNEYPDFQGNRRVKEHLNAAKRYRDGDYRKILLTQPSV